MNIAHHFRRHLIRQGEYAIVYENDDDGGSGCDGGRATVNVSGTMAVTLHDSASLSYYGNPAITVHQIDDDSDMKRLGLTP